MLTYIVARVIFLNYKGLYELSFNLKFIVLFFFFLFLLCDLHYFLQIF